MKPILTTARVRAAYALGLITPTLALAGMPLLLSADVQMDMAVSRCEKLGYNPKTDAYRECVREQLRLISTAPSATGDKPEKTEPDSPPATSSTPTKSVKRLGSAKIGRMPPTTGLNNVLGARRMLTAMTSVNVCVDSRGSIIGEPTVVYSSLDESFDAAVIEYAKTGRYFPPPETDKISGGCVTFRVVKEYKSDATPMPIEVVTALVNGAKGSDRFDVPQAKTKSVTAYRDGSGVPTIGLEYSLSTDPKTVTSDYSTTDQLELWRSRLGNKLCVDAEWAALFKSGVTANANFTRISAGDPPSFHLRFNADVCERHSMFHNANHGNKDAAYALGLSYRRGGVVWRENPETYFWFAVAERLGHEDGQRMKLEAAKYLNVPQIDRMKERLALWNPRATY